MAKNILEGVKLGVLFALAAIEAAAAVTFTVPSKALTGGHAYAPLEPAPIGISFEFFTYPSYFTNVTATNQCLSNWKDLTGVWPPIRIGGTTQDRARYDSETSAYVVYKVASAADAPSTLTFGPSFMTLAGKYRGSVVLGLNRGKNDIGNTITAAKAAVGMNNLLAIELGNEPEYFSKDSQPIASGGWSAAVDAASQNNWDILVGTAVGKKAIIQAGNSNDSPPTWGAAELITKENATVKEYVNTYAHHNYPGGTVTSLMSHANIVKDLQKFDADITAALAQGKPYVFGETNSVSGGGAATVSPTFGAGLWTMDYSLRAAYSNVSRTYFHHGTIGNCQYCFWGRNSMGAPYYGAYAATAMLAKASYLTAIDDGKTNYAAYVTFDAQLLPLRALLYNSDQYSGSGTRSHQSFVLDGLLSGTTVRAKRLTAASAVSRQDQGDVPSFGGQSFVDGTCMIKGVEAFETVAVSSGQVSFDLQASEALLVYLQ